MTDYWKTPQQIKFFFFLFFLISYITAPQTPNSLAKLISFSTLSSFLIISILAIKIKVLCYIVRTGHLEHTLNPLLYEKYCTGMYSIEELKHCVLVRV
jgi:hypothetical protein